MVHADPISGVDLVLNGSAGRTVSDTAQSAHPSLLRRSPWLRALLYPQPATIASASGDFAAKG
ncbi:hypothetical protein D9M72_430330 [compost metagenome]